MKAKVVTLAFTSPASWLIEVTIPTLVPEGAVLVYSPVKPAKAALIEPAFS